MNVMERSHKWQEEKVEKLGRMRKEQDAQERAMAKGKKETIAFLEEGDAMRHGRYLAKQERLEHKRKENADHAIALSTRAIANVVPSPSSSRPTSPGRGGGLGLGATADATPAAPPKGSPRAIEKRGPGGNLYKLARPLLQSGGTTQNCAKVLKRVEYVLGLGGKKRTLPASLSPLSPHSWQGPETPLVVAVRAAAGAAVAPGNDGAAGARGLVSLLLRARGNPVLDPGGQTPLFFAGTKAVCEAILAGQADPGCTTAKGQSALHAAAKGGHSEVLVSLAERATPALVGLRDASGATAADYACNAGLPLEVLEKLAERQRRPLTPRG
jgi:hypothetical protein